MSGAEDLLASAWDRSEVAVLREGAPGGRGVVRRHPVAALLTWSALVGQPLAAVPALAASAGRDLPVMPFVAASTLLGLLLPAVVVTALDGGRPAVTALLRAAVSVRPGAGWWAFAVVGVPAGAAGVCLAVAGEPVVALSALPSTLVWGLLLPTMLGLVTVNLAEEVAWTGVVQRRLGQRWGVGRASLVCGPLFAAQHAALLLGGPPLQVLAVLGALAVLAVPFRYLTAQVAARSGSLLVVGVLHASGNAAAAPGGLLAQWWPGSAVVGVAHLFALALAGAGAAVVVAVVRRGPVPHFGR